MRTLLLGLDIGTSSCKAAAFTPDGAIAASASAEYPVYYPRPGWAEQSPAEWWQGVCAAVRALFAQSDIAPAEIAAIGVDGQSWSAIPLDRHGEALCRTPIWMDTRAGDICGRLRAQLGEEAVFAVCGNPLQPSYSLPKVLWYRENRPDVYAQADKILQSNSYIVFCLTGEISQDLSQCYGYQCFDMQKGVWDRALGAEMGLDLGLLPEIVPCHQVVGRVTPAAAGLTGLAAGTPVVAGGLDAACGTLGAGVLENGQTQEQGGQAGGMSICLDRCRADPRLILGRHVVPDRWLLQGGTVGGGGIMRWLEAELGEAERRAARQNGTHPMQEMDKLAATVPPGSEGVLFLPYMAGERSPIWDPDAKGVWYGLDFSKTRGHLFRAALEGAAFALYHNLTVAEQAGAGVERLRAMGGAANSRLWTQIKCDVTGKPVDVPAADTATTLGAAMLAGVGAGVYADFAEAVGQTVRLRRTHLPDPKNHQIYRACFARYLALYESLKPLMRSQQEG